MKQLEKSRQRRVGYWVRNRQSDRAELSRRICSRWLALPAFQQAGTVLIYVACRSEVDTLPAIESLLRSDKRLVVPYCTQDDFGDNKLGLWHLNDLTELAPGTWGILEPPEHRWGESGKAVEPGQIDWVVVPGVAFDRNGGRLGNGAGYYDRLLANVRPDTVLCGVCFECQLFDEIVMAAHDIRMDYIVTEKEVYFD